MLRSGKLQNESSQNFSNFLPKFPPKLPRFYSRIFRALFLRHGDHKKKSPKSPDLFQYQIPRQIRIQKKNHKMFLERQSTVGTKMIADPEKCFQELISQTLLILLRDRPCLELIIVFNNFPIIFPPLRGKIILELSALKPINSSKKVLKLLGPSFPRINSVQTVSSLLP